MTLSSLRICLGIFLLVEVQSPIQVGASNIDRGEPGKSPLTILRREAQDPAPAPASTPPQAAPLVLRVRDENGAPVTSAKVSLYAEGERLVASWETDFQGRVAMTRLAPGLYQLRVEKQGFYSSKLEQVEVGKAESFDLTLGHEQEIRESVDVTSAPPTIDQTRTVASDEIGAREITNLPYPRKRDFKNMVVYLPRVHQDSTGQLHLNGAASYQTFYALDGFNISNPASGLLELRVSPDSLRKIEIQSSRISAEYGKVSGGVLNLTTGMGDDRFRVAATDFAPSAQFVHGISLDSWTPRVAIGGPIRKGRAWFYSAADAEVDNEIRRDLPQGANQNKPWRLGELAKGQVNLSPTHLVNVSALVNRFHSENSNLSEANPLGTAPELKQDVYLADVKDQVFRANGLMVETGLAASRFHSAVLPHGDLPYQLVPGKARGSYFMTSNVVATRLQGLMNITLSPAEWGGRHEMKLGADINHVGYDRLLARNPIQILRADNTLSSEILFDSVSQARRDNVEAGVYLQDRWAVSNRLLIESGIRFDRDSIVKHVLASPRLSASALLTKNGDTRLALGAGLFYDASNLDFVTRPLEGRRVDQFFARDGMTMLANKTAETAFTLNEERLEAPRSFGWSMEFERKLPAEIYFRAEYIGRRGIDGYTFELQGAEQPRPLMTVLELTNTRKDRYDALSLTTRRAFKERYLIFASYTRSSARTNAVLDFSLDTPLFSPQAGGPLDYDAPDRLISWGSAPLIKKFDLAYSLEWRSGYPFSVFNQDRRLVEEPNSRRFPAYVSLNLHAERRVRILSFNLALRGGFNNITNRRNAVAVDNNINSSGFLHFSGIQGRQFTARIRFLGRK
ncbi:MAG TPA: TonB-dependent receptor [Blastocatellia bacterium]|nr:TonB-dependent receptor [Blastocatellia bacterium]